MAKSVFRAEMIKADSRVTPVMTKCLSCHAQLSEPQTAGSGATMMLFAQCAGCKKVYVLDCASFAL